MRCNSLLILLLLAVGLLSSGVPGAIAADSDRLRGVVEPLKAKKPYRIGVTLVHFIDDYWKGQAYGILDEAKRSNVQIVRLLSAGGYGKISDQIANLELFDSMKVDAVIMGPVAFNGFDKIVERLAKDGIKVLMTGSPIQSKYPFLWIANDEVAIGKTMGEYMCKQKPGAKVVTIPGPPGAEWNKLRFDGFKQASAACNLQLIGNIFEKSTGLEDGVSEATDLLIKTPDADFLYAVDGEVGVGAAVAAKKLNSKVRIVSSAFVEQVPSLMKQGRIDMYVSEPAVLYGRLDVQYVIRELEGLPLPNARDVGQPYPGVFIPPVAITAHEIGDYDLFKYDMPPTNWTPPASQ